MVCSPPGSSIHGILQARILECVAISFSRGSSQPTDWTWVSCVAGRLFTVWATRPTTAEFWKKWEYETTWPASWEICMQIKKQQLEPDIEKQTGWVWSLGQEDPLEKEMATHSSILAWRIPWMEEPGALQSTGLQRVRHDWATSLSLFQTAKGVCQGCILSPCLFNLYPEDIMWNDRLVWSTSWNQDCWEKYQ